MADPTTSAPGPWLDADERAMWLALTALTVRLPAALDAQLERDGDLRYFEYLFLAMLCEQPSQSMQMSELAAITNASLSRLSHVARRLESAGYLRREIDARDRRCTHAIATDDGRRKVESVARGHVETVRRMVFDPLDRDHVIELNATLRAILASIDIATNRSTIFPD